MFFSDLLVLATFVSSLSALRGQWNPLSQSSFQKSRMLQRRFSQSASSVSLFYIIFILLLRLQSCGAQSDLICSHQPIVALAGDDVILPCHLEPPISASSETVVWTRTDLDPKYIHVRHKGQPAYQSQNPSYTNRTALFVDQLMNGNVSLKLFRVKISDAGKYFCFFQSMQNEAFVRLIAGVVSTPIIEVVSNNNGSVVLQCKSKGWYPKPEVFWLDGEGSLLSAGPTKTVKGPDDLYTVSSRVTVEKRHSNNFTCRVQQKNINQTRETQIYVPADFFTVQSSSCLILIITIPLGTALLFLIIITLIIKCLNGNQEELERMCQPREMYTMPHNTARSTPP